MFNIGPGELIVILLLALIIFGPGKLPDVGKALGRTINEFKRATRQIEEDMTSPPPRRSEPAERDRAESAPAAGSPSATGSGSGGQRGHVG